MVLQGPDRGHQHHRVGQRQAGLRKPHLQPVHDLVGNLVYCGKASDVETVVVDGRVVVEKRQIEGIDLERLYADVAAAVERIKRA